MTELIGYRARHSMHWNQVLGGFASGIAETLLLQLSILQFLPAGVEALRLRAAPLQLALQFRHLLGLAGVGLRIGQSRLGGSPRRLGRFDERFHALELALLLE